jgi:hypothetical protein
MTKQGDTQAAVLGKRSVTKNILVAALGAAVLVSGSASATLYVVNFEDQGVWRYLQVNAPDSKESKEKLRSQTLEHIRQEDPTL